MGSKLIYFSMAGSAKFRYYKGCRCKICFIKKVVKNKLKIGLFSYSKVVKLERFLYINQFFKKMDKNLAEKLVDELERHPRISGISKDKCIDLLVPTKISRLDKSYENIPENDQLLKGVYFDSYSYLSLDKVLRNGYFGIYKLSFLKDNALVRDLKNNKDLINIMSQCEHPFSLLGKLETYDLEDTVDRDLFIIKRPILVVPEIKDMKKVLEWEDKNIRHYKEVGFSPFRHLKRISRAEYLSY